MSRLQERYRDEVVPALRKEFGYTTIMAVPRIERVVVNMGIGEATQNPKLIDAAADELTRITGQRPVTTRARKSVAAFKLRQGMAIGSMVTLRGGRMFEFSRSPDFYRAAPRAGLPRHIAGRVRRSGQLHAGSP